MASTINAKNTSTGVVITPDASGQLELQTADVTRLTIDSSGYVTNAVNGLGNGRVQAYQYYRLNSGLAGANVNTVQSMFGVGVTLVGSTVYEFEMSFTLSKSAGTTSHTISLGFGGTATLNNINYSFFGPITVATTGNAGTMVSYLYSSASLTAATSAITAAGVAWTVLIKGIVSVNAGGTFIPQYSLSAAPGGAYTVQAGSYIKISPLSASGSNTSIGTWA